MLSFRSSVLRLRKPSDVCDGLLAHLNIHLEKDIPVGCLVHQDSFVERPFLYDNDLDAMLAELDTENEGAYREIMRLPPLEGRKKPRLAYSRNFFAGLEDMRRYYDASQDNYYEVGTDEKERQEEVSGRNNGEKGDSDGDSKMTYEDVGPSTKQPSTSLQTATAQDDSKTELPTSETKKQVYKGLRLGNAASLPPPTRTSTVRSLIKMVTHKFNCRDYDPYPKERLKITDIVIPQGVGPWGIGMYTFAIVKLPADMKLARGRFVEGPLMGVNVRHEAVFEKKKAIDEKKVVENDEKRTPQPGPGDGSARSEPQGPAFDLSREIASMLFLAMQRNREAKGSREEVHEKETEKWWWTKNERWGGGPTKWGQLACDVYEDEDPSWSPEERELQLKKRKEAEEEMQRFAEVDAHGKDVKVEDLIAGAKEKEKSGDDRSGRSERGPPKKKNRVDIPDRPRKTAENGNGEKDGDGKTTNSKSKAGSGKRSKDSDPEYHEGRRVMYIPPTRKKFFKEWQTVRPNGSTWDEKMIHRRIGRPTTASHSEEDEQANGDGEWDEVYQVTSVNHHVAIMKMRISKRYLQWLETGDVEKRDEGGEEDKLKVWRSEWFDMFDREERKKWLVGMWRVMCWVCRDEVPKAEWERWEKMKAEQKEN